MENEVETTIVCSSLRPLGLRMFRVQGLVFGLGIKDLGP